MLIISLPIELSFLNDKSFNWHEINVGMSGNHIYVIKNIKNERYVLKVSKHGINLEPEYKRIIWINNRLPVPKIYNFLEINKKQYLLMSYIYGKPSFFPVFKDRDRIIKLLASSLKLIHTIKTDDCPFDESIESKLMRARENLIKGTVSFDNIDLSTTHKTPEEYYRDLLLNIPTNEEMVFTHGDYCLPNILVNNYELAGFVDLGLSGIGDKYQDLALCARSIRFNFGEEWIKPFFTYYGIEKVDTEKMFFFTILDEFF